MKRLLLAGAAGLALATAALPAHAWPTRDYEGGCSFSTVNDPLTGGALGGPDRYTGVMYVAVVATDQHGVPLPSSTISVDCEVYVNGVLTDVAMSASGVGAATAAGTFSFDVGPTDFVYVCDRVVVDGEEIFDCWGDDPVFPPEPIPYLLDEGVRALNEAIFEPIVDPLVCPALGGLAPGVPGILDITPEGDATIFDGTFWDCPPYD